MSTRATYSIQTEGLETTFYIHHDGYPDGAAVYFRNAREYECEAPNATFGDAFMRANSRAELTPSHDVHADTEYRYNYRAKDDQLMVMKRHADDQWYMYWSGRLEQFLNDFPELINKGY